MKIIAKNHLTKKDLQSIAQLNSYYPDYAPYYESDSNNKETCFFLAYEEDCIGFLSFLWVADSDFPEEAELTAMVAPAFCHKQIFTAMLEACRKECKKLGITRLYFATRQSTANAYSHSELLMQLTTAEYADQLSDASSAIRSSDSLPAPYYVVRESDIVEADNPNHSKDIVHSKGIVPANALVQEQDTHKRTDDTDIGQCAFLLYDADANPVGLCRLCEEASFTNLWGIEINAAYRQQGLATALLSFVLKEYFAHTNKPLILQVGSRNVAALHLYQRLGFVITQRIDYELVR